jgi:rod shape determining protein RodA
MVKRIVGSIGRYIRQTDILLFLLCLVASSLGILMLFGIVNAELMKISRLYVQIAATVLGIIAAIIMSKIDYHFMAKLWKLHVPCAILLVLLTFVWGQQRGEADDKAWIFFNLSSNFQISIQPSEILKISFVLSFALHLEAVRENINKLKNVIFLCIHGLYPVVLIHFQGDDGTALVFLFVFLCMIFSAGISWKYIFLAMGAMAAAIPILWNTILTTDQKNRILAIWDYDFDTQNIGWQQLQGRISIGSGQIWGIGIFSPDHRSGVPEIHNDFIFAFIAESVGFIGSVAILLLLVSIGLKILSNSRLAQDYLGKYICIGVSAIIMTQIFINIGMCLSILPVIGITLPFFSSGGTSAATLYLAIGLSLSVYMHNRRTLFS